jgi:hypothetical protein
MPWFVSCHVPDNSDLDRRMQGIGGVGWYMSVDEVLIRLGRGEEFIVSYAGLPQVRVIPGQNPFTGRPFIQTEADGFGGNNLLRLPRCPGR